MTEQRELDPYTSPKAFYGAEVRREREERGWSQDSLGKRVFCSGTYIGQLEAATRRPQPDLSELLDKAFGTGTYFQRLCRLARKSKHADYFADAAELEQRAKTISEYAPMLVPGLLQTEAYARALMKTVSPYASMDEIEQNVRVRMDRQEILKNSTGPMLWEIVHEAALRVPVGGPDVMRNQLSWLVEVGRSPRAVVQVHPYSAGPHMLMLGVFSFMTFADAPPLVYSEGPHSGQLVEEPAVVERYQATYDLARAAALPPEASLTLIESVAEDWANS
ncbi:helix-turn-helix transcriptional regulator [Streptomyces sp. WMMB303]|uniref:helix-turn-helix domain-containing protein n=1 Tax=Streptomyces sp. WMMB303 TaxID=3034154 RepID=UPI0023EC57E3|nr:helix-turn-helix transcriptional regulator [Streptomyces sp. WMMB303]MDF4251129.1 helix-turn-helix transcriptional regulator [Streptomyces sp. WMMB303]